MNLAHLLELCDRQQIIEALYFVVRNLKQSELEEKFRKEHLQDAPNSLPTATTEAATKRVVDEIEKTEGNSIYSLTKERREHYMYEILSFAKEVNKQSKLVDSARGRTLLDDLRGDTLS